MYSKMFCSTFWGVGAYPALLSMRVTAMLSIRALSAAASDTHVAKTVSMTKCDNNITGVDFDEEAVQQNWRGGGDLRGVSVGVTFSASYLS